MEFFPQSKFLRFYSLKANGIEEKYVPIKQIIPITKYDYWCASWWCQLKQNNIIDLDMIYANQSNKEMYIFDKEGEWNDEGVYHEGLNVENTFDEATWYDEFNSDTH
uniref:Uncharacterized protein n=1 Tax=Strombidium inclinatum TaxID=197538 RepID=A0A7S3MV86_9SPIT|mmetsp:Transcript_16619/g.25618  ORF Transcript_16619/g.25618 Transcript_16619/m.25618 type:complete len:107 (+) Transcript_16619:447-767(+)